MTRLQGPDRRQFPRIRVFEEIQGRIMPLDDGLRVQDISLGGFAVETPLGFMPGSEHAFEFTTTDGQQAVLRATNVHCMRINRRDGHAVYFAGFAFDRLRAEDRQAIDDLVNAVGSVSR